MPEGQEKTICMNMSSSVATRLQYQHKSLLDIIDGLSEDQIRIRKNPEKWSIFETIVHLQTYQHIFRGRVKEIRNGNVPAFERYSADTDPVFIENCNRSVREVMQDLITTRKEMAAEMLPLPMTELNKTGSHPVYGILNLQLWLNFFLLHEAHHLFAIFRQAGAIRTGK
jgi:uncharacterized damage-inducible protein DinB